MMTKKRLLLLVGVSGVLGACGPRSDSVPGVGLYPNDYANDDAVGRPAGPGARRLTDADLPTHPVEIPGGWREIITRAAFKFHIPGEFNELPSQPIDSYAVEYQGPDMRLSFDYGMYSGGTDSPEELIDGRRARIETQERESDFGGDLYSYYAEVRFEDIGRGHDNLSMHAYAKTPEAVEQAKIIFRTIDFD